MKILNNSLNLVSQQNNNKKPIFTGYRQTVQKSIDKFISTICHTEEQECAFKKVLFKNLSKILKEKNYISEGMENFIYKISPKYALKIPKHYVIRNDKIPNKIKVTPNLFENIKNYYGNPVVELNDVKILKNLGKNMPIGAKNSMYLESSQKELEKYYLNTYLPKVANIPQISYDELAHNFNKFNSIGFPSGSYAQFDALNPNNTVIKNDRFYFVDDINQVRGSYTNSAAKLLNMFLSRMTATTTAPTSQDSYKLSRIIFKKILMASQKENLIIAGERQDGDFLKIVMKQCNIDEKSGGDCLSKLDSLSSCKNVDERLKLSEDVIDSLFKNN